MQSPMILVSLAMICWAAGAQNIHSQIFVLRSPASEAVISSYLSMEMALAADNGKEAATSGKTLFEALSKINPKALSKSDQKELTEILDDAKEHAEHISKSGSDIDHQREHFATLGKDIKDLVVLTGADRTLYQLHCPMYNKDEGGAIWLSDSKEVNNPYFGHKMPVCGSVQQEIALK